MIRLATIVMPRKIKFSYSLRWTYIDIPEMISNRNEFLEGLNVYNTRTRSALTHHINIILQREYASANLVILRLKLIKNSCYRPHGYYPPRLGGLISHHQNMFSGVHFLETGNWYMYLVITR